MRLRALLFLAVAAVLAGCGGSRHAAPSVALQTWFYRGAALVPVVVHVPQTKAVATTAVESLLAGPPQGYRTAVPSGTQLQSLAIAGGTASAQLAPSTLAREAQAQLVYTLTQFRSVKRVELSGTPAVTRDDYVDLTPAAPIFVASPLRGSTVTSPVRASGTSDVFEGTMQVDVYSGGRKLRTQTVTATSGSGTRGTWKATFALPPGPARLDFYEPSAENGSKLHETIVDLTVQ